MRHHVIEVKNTPNNYQWVINIDCTPTEFPENVQKPSLHINYEISLLQRKLLFRCGKQLFNERQIFEKNSLIFYHFTTEIYSVIVKYRSSN